MGNAWIRDKLLPVCCKLVNSAPMLSVAANSQACTAAALFEPCASVFELIEQAQQPCLAPYATIFCTHCVRSSPSYFSEQACLP